MRKYVLVLLLLNLILCQFTIAGQTYIDSINKQIDISKQDTSKVQLLLKGAIYYINSNSDSAFYFINKTLQLSNKIGYDQYTAHAFKVLSNFYYNQFKTDSSIFYIQKALNYFVKHQQTVDIALCYNLLGANYMDLTDYKQAMLYYLKADSAFNLVGHKNGRIIVCQNLAIIFLKIKDYDKAIQYNRKSIILNEEVNNLQNLAIGYNNLADVFTLIGESDSAIYYYSQSISYNKKVNDIFLMAMSLHNIAEEYQKQGKYKEAYSNYTKALKIKEKLNNSKSLAATLIGLSVINLKFNNYEEAIGQAKRAYEIAKKDSIREILSQVLLNLSNVYAYSNHFKEAYNYAIEYAAWNDTIYNSNTQKTVLELNTKYEALKKEDENKLLFKENSIQKTKLRQNQIITYSAITVFLLVSALFILLYRNKKNKYKAEKLITAQNEKLAKQEYTELLSKSKINIIKAQFSGIENEQNRIAHELHDGVGSTLSAIKMKLERAEFLSKTEASELLKHVSEAYANLRNVSHNLAPPQFENASIVDVISDYLFENKSYFKFQCVFSYFPVNESWAELDFELQNSLHKIIQEALTNIAKHANSDRVDIQLTKHDVELILTIEDNGLGFNANANNSGLGLKSIKNRVRILNGNIQIDSHPNKGTTIIVNIPLTISATVLAG